MSSQYDEHLKEQEAKLEGASTEKKTQLQVRCRMPDGLRGLVLAVSTAVG